MRETSTAPQQDAPASLCQQKHRRRQPHTTPTKSIMPPVPMDSWEKEVADHEVVIISKSWCPYCRILIQQVLDMRVPNVKVIEVDQLPPAQDPECKNPWCHRACDVRLTGGFYHFCPACNNTNQARKASRVGRFNKK